MAALTGSRRRFVFDPRFLVGVALVVASVAGVWWVVSAADKTVPVYAARATLPEGGTLRAGDLAVVRVRLGDAARLYERPTPQGVGKAVLARTVAAGELLPVAALRKGQDADTTTVVVPARAPLPRSVAVGERADLWSAQRLERDGFGPPAVLVPGAVVVAVSESTGLAADRSTVSVELRVPARAVAPVLAALAGGDSVSVLPARFEAGQ